MALSILDGNQSATTLSTILSSGQHITAHTVVSLGTQAITDIVNATSAGLTNTQLRASAVTVGGTVTVGNSLTISSLPAISGTVTANVPQTTVTKGTGQDAESIIGIPVIPKFIVQTGTVGVPTDLPITFVGGNDDTFLKNVLFKTDIDGENALIVGDGNPLPISGTVTIGSVPNGTLTTRFGSIATANTAFSTTAVTNTSRKYLMIQNIASTVITAGIGFTPTTTQGIQIVAGATITFDGNYIPTGAVRILSSVTASNFTVLEA